MVAVERWKAAHGNQIQGHDIVVGAEDDGCTAPDAPKLAAERLLDRRGLVGVLGPQCSAGVVESLSTYTDAGVVTISGSATASGLAEDQPAPGFFFRTAYRNDFQGVLIGVYVIDIVGADSATVIDDGETYGLDLASSVEQYLTAAGVGVSRTSVPQGAVDFSQLASEVAQEDPGVVFFAGFNPQAPQLLRQLRDTGWAGAFAAGDAVCGAAECEFLVALDELAEGVTFSGCSPPLAPAFVSEFEAVHGTAPTAAFVTHYADAATILLDAVSAVAVRQSNGGITFEPAALRAALAASLLSRGLSGDVAFDDAGDRTSVLLESGAPRATASDLGKFAQELGLVPCRVENGTIVYFD